VNRVTLVVLAVLVAGFVSAKLRYSGVTPVKLPAGDCNADLWKHVYSPERLRVVEACTAVTGRVVSMGRSSDGDLHFAVDPDRKSVLNLVNVVHTHGDLLVEVVCEHIPSDGDARAVCAGFNPQVLIIPKVGEHVRIIGASVTDRDNGWNEVHPVTSIENIGPSTESPRAMSGTRQAASLPEIFGVCIRGSL